MIGADETENFVRFSPLPMLGVCAALLPAPGLSVPDRAQHWGQRPANFMPFVKLDCGILESSLWFDKAARDIFITALLMARPHVQLEAIGQLETQSLKYTGWMIPAGCYGMVDASGPGVLNRAGMNSDDGWAALARLGDPDKHSRSDAFDGRRLVRVDGGYLVLNYDHYRELDYTNAERQKRWREAHKSENTDRNALRKRNNALRNGEVTHADADADAVLPAPPPQVPPLPGFSPNGEGAGGNGNGNSAWHPTQIMLRLNKLYRRRPSTAWTKEMLKALKKHEQDLQDDDLRCLEAYYAAKIPESQDYRRHDLETLLNHLGGEIDRARRFKPIKPF